MFDFIRNLAKSAEEKRLETLNAYADGELSAGERRQFEAELADDAALRAELAQLRQVKQGIQQLPRARAPRNFTLDPAVYGRPQRQPAYDLYPVLRVATALAAFFFIVAVVLDLATPAGGLGQPFAAVSRQEEPAAAVEVAEEAAEAEPVEVTQVVEEVVVEEGEPVEVTRIVTEREEEGEMAAAGEEEGAAAQAEALEEAPAEEAEQEEAMEAETAAEVAEEPAEEEEEPAAEAEDLTAPAEDEAADEAVATGEAAEAEEAPAAAAPVTTATETVPPTLTSQVPEATPTAEGVPAEEPVDGGLPLLLIAEIVFGLGLVVLLTVTLFIRRNL